MRPGNANQDAWHDYHDTIDELRHTQHVRNFQQVVGEHARHLIQTGVNFGNRAQSLLWNDGEVLTDLAHEWHQLATRSSDPHEFRRVGTMAIRAPSRCAQRLVAARLDRHGDHIVQHHRGQLAAAVNLASLWHKELDCTNSAVHANLSDLWEDYYGHLDAAIEALSRGGPESTQFYRRGAAFIRTAQMIGNCLDMLIIK